MINVQELKKKAITYLENNGPTIPVRIGKVLGVDPMWAGAILSELLESHQAKFTSMKVGSTPIYYLAGQEIQLEKFADEHLKEMPKKAYLLLKEKKVLDDAMQEPQIRVALRSIKDFAAMFNHNGRILWRYTLCPDNEIEAIVSGESKEESGQEAVKQDVAEDKSEEEPTLDESTVQDEETDAEVKEESNEIIKDEAGKDVGADVGSEEVEETLSEPEEEKKVEDIFEGPQEELLDKVKKHLEKLNIKLLEETDVKKREFLGLGRMQGPLGETEILILAKDKKNITDKDLEKIFERIKIDKKQVLLFTTGEIAKKSVESYRDYKNLIRVRPL
ncbi:hypothetical protein HN747_04535 [archaeon]|mgnify:CR=1 FL=1|jgi:hypothetical protein|nr:hypothetical protein [archaeon]